MIEIIHSRNRRPPIITSTAALFCILVYVCQVVLHPAVRKFTLNPQRIIRDWEWYRIITSSFIHANFMHILMNMVSYFALGSTLERRLGSIFMLFIVLWSSIMCSVVHVTIAMALFYLDSGPFSSNSLGFSAILFHVLVLECSLNPNLSRSLFGMIDVSSRSYPYFLLILIQILVPNISFLGHFSGIIVGSLQNFWGPVLIPSADFLIGLDDRRLCTSIEMLEYISTSRDGINQLYLNTRNQDTSMCTTFFRCIQNIAETVMFILFGRQSGRPTSPGGLSPALSNELDDLVERNPNSNVEHKTRSTLIV